MTDEQQIDEALAKCDALAEKSVRAIETVDKGASMLLAGKAELLEVMAQVMLMPAFVGGGRDKLLGMLVKTMVQIDAALIALGAQR